MWKGEERNERREFCPVNQFITLSITSRDVNFATIYSFVGENPSHPRAKERKGKTKLLNMQQNSIHARFSLPHVGDFGLLLFAILR